MALDIAKLAREAKLTRWSGAWQGEHLTFGLSDEDLERFALLVIASDSAEREEPAPQLPQGGDDAPVGE